MYKAIEVFKPNRDRDREMLEEMKNKEKKLKKKMKRVNIFNGYVMTTNPKVWNEKSK